jgi:hypothetical protein
MQPSELRGYFAASVETAEAKSVGSILEVLYLAALRLGKDFLIANRQAVIDAVLDAFDSACVLIDIPRVPEFMEVRIEAALRGMLENALQMLPTE